MWKEESHMHILTQVSIFYEDSANLYGNCFDCIRFLSVEMLKAWPINYACFWLSKTADNQ